MNISMQAFTFNNKEIFYNFIQPGKPKSKQLYLQCYLLPAGLRSLSHSGVPYTTNVGGCRGIVPLNVCYISARVCTRIYTYIDSLYVCVQVYKRNRTGQEACHVGSVQSGAVREGGESGLGLVRNIYTGEGVEPEVKARHEDLPRA